MTDFSGTFPGLVTLNDGDRITGNCTFNGGMTIASGGPSMDVTGNFLIILGGGVITTTPTGPRFSFQSDAILPSNNFWQGLRFDVLTAGSIFKNGIIKHAADALTWSSSYNADNVDVDMITLERGTNTLVFSQTVDMVVGEIERIDGGAFTAIAHSGPNKVTLARFYNSNSGHATSSRVFAALSSTGTLRIDEIIMEGTVANANLFQRTGSSPILDIGAIYQYTPGNESGFFNFAASSGLIIGGGIMTVGGLGGSFYQFCLGAANLVKDIDYYNHGGGDFSVQGPNHTNCAFLGADNQSIDAINTSVDVGTADGILEATVSPFNEDSITDVRSSVNHPETVVVGTVTPGPNSVSVDFTIRTPGESYLVISTAASPIVVSNQGDLAQYNDAGSFDYTQRIDLNGTGKVFTSNVLTGDRNLTADGLKGGALLRARILHRLPRTQKFAFSTEFTFTPTLADTVPPVFAGGVSGIAAVDTITDSDVTLSANVATDAGGSNPVRYKYFIKAGDGDPFAAPDLVVLLETNAATPVRFPANTLHSVGVHALDSLSNETTNTDFVTVTPTFVSQNVPVPGALQSFLTAE